MLRSFVLRAPRIAFGPGERSRLPALAAEAAGEAAQGGTVVLTGATRAPALRSTLAAALDGLAPTWLACAPGEPTVEGVDGLLARVRDLRPALIVGVGGGSVLDTAKILAALTPLNGSVLGYLEGIGSGLAVPRPGVPWIALPTTAGTGAEATLNAVVKSSGHGLKRSLRSPHTMASWAVVDPELSADAPTAVTGAAGMDALAQLVEAYVTRTWTAPVRALVRDALPRQLAALRVLAVDPANAEARAAAAYAALVSGIALANAGLGAVHGFAAALGGATELPHGLICAVFLAPVLRANADAIRADLLPLCLDAGMGPGRDPVAWLAGEVQGLLGAFGMPRRLARGPGGTGGSGFSAAELAALAEASSGSSMSGNPVSLEIPARLAILREALVT